MKTRLVVAAVLSVGLVAVTVSDYGAARDSYQRSAAALTEASSPSPGGRHAALADAESNGPSPGGRDTALAEGESNGHSPGGHDAAQG